MPQGTIKKLIAEKGFGFIEYGSAEEGQKAIDALNGTELQGRKITVAEARPREDRGGGGGGGGGVTRVPQSPVRGGVCVA